MELTQHLQDMLVKTSRDVEYIREELEKNDKRYHEHDKRLRKVEESQSFLAGKITILVMGSGIIMLAIINVIMKLIK